MNMVRNWSLLVACAIPLVITSTIAYTPRATAAVTVQEPSAAGGDAGNVTQHNPWG